MRKKAIGILMGAAMMIAALCSGGRAFTAEAEQKAEPHNPVYHADTDSTEWDYVYFGSYPQTQLTGEAVTDAVRDAQYDLYGDATVEGERYRRVQARTANYTSAVQAEGFFSWSDLNYGYAYFKYEPIKWRVLENDGESLFLMADSVLDCKRYAQNDNSVTWETSSARKWLNGYEMFGRGGYSFINMAFTDEEQDTILDTTVTGSDNPLHKTTGGKDSIDKLFYLSIREVTNEKYGFCPDFMTYSRERMLKPTGYAHTMGVWKGSPNDLYGDYCWWLLRSTGSHTKAVSMVYRFGHVYQDGYYADTPYYGVCPAMRLDINSPYWVLADDAAGRSVQEEDTNGRLGDADGDGSIDLSDAQIALRAALKIVPETKYPMCDVDGDYHITLNDAQYILKYALKIISSFPAEPVQNPERSSAPAEPSGMPIASLEPTGITVTAQPSASADISRTPKPTGGAVILTPPPRASAGCISPEPPTSAAPPQSEGPLVQEKHDPTGTIWIAADSIAVSYHSTEAMGLCGWGEVIGEYFTDEVQIRNQAIGGRSSKSFIQESKYNTMMDNMAAGDYLLISFGHNDERAALELYTDPFGSSSDPHSYKWYLKECYIDPAIRKGVQPVLISPVARRYFYQGKLINPQLHTPYAKAMEELVEEYAQMGIQVHYIDLHQYMLDMYEELGEDGTYSLHAKNDTTHLCRAGINIVCDRMIDQMKKKNMSIIKFLKPDAS